MIEARELRIGNYIERLGKYDKSHICIEIVRNIPEAGVYGDLPSSYCFGMQLTETNILKLRVIERADFTPIIFEIRPPGERQVENQYWSGFIHEDYKLHLSPSYKTVFPNENIAVKSSEIDFWFVWYCEGNRFMPLMNIRNHKMKYVHQLQNLYFDLTGKEVQLMS